MSWAVLIEMSLRLLLALGLGIVIGLERQLRQSNAGLRTNTLVALGSASFVVLSQALTAGQGDPSRVVGQIVTGIGFLGGGVILKEGLTIRGLNTAATIWCSSGVGAFAGAGFYSLAGVLTGLVLLVHIALLPVSRWLDRRSFRRSLSVFHSYRLDVQVHEQSEPTVRDRCLTFLRQDEHLRLVSIQSSDAFEAEQVIIEIEIEANEPADASIENLAAIIQQLEGVHTVRWKPLAALSSEF